MKGIILAGGAGTRLDPLTRVTNKHLLPVYNKPMIYYPIEKMVEAGVTEIMIVSGKGHAGHFLELLRSGKDFRARFSYGVQEEPGGIAQALGLCRDFADNGNIIVILGDNVFEDSLKNAVEEFTKQEVGAKIFLSEVPNPKSYGIAEIDGDNILNIEEKPAHPKTNLAVVGVYMYDNQVWDIIQTLKPSKRGELEITDVNNYYISKHKMRFSVLKGWWGDCGESFESYLHTSNLVAKTFKKKD